MRAIDVLRLLHEQGRVRAGDLGCLVRCERERVHRVLSRPAVSLRPELGFGEEVVCLAGKAPLCLAARDAGMQVGDAELLSCFDGGVPEAQCETTCGTTARACNDVCYPRACDQCARAGMTSCPTCPDSGFVECWDCSAACERQYGHCIAACPRG